MESMESRECVHCINFKTVTITENNKTKYHQAICEKVQKKLKTDDSVQIWYCKFGIMDKVYITRNIIDKIIYKGCPQYNNSELK